MKKIIVILIAFISMFALASCSDDSLSDLFGFGDDSSQLENIIFESKTVAYDGKAHNLYVENLPEGYTVEYSLTDAVEIGVYFIDAKIYNSKNEMVVIKSATLTIMERETVELPLV